MRPTTSLWTAVLLASSALAQSQSQCVTNCETSHLESSACQGDETGQALADCTCASFQGPKDPMIVCIKACPAADVAAFAAGIPTECRGKLFPEISAVSSSGTASQTQTEISSSAATTSSSAMGSKTTVTTATGPTTAAAASSTHTGLAAMNQPAGMVMAIGVLAAFAI
ncbi:uncharacterized protein CDV56_108106 [Aspergillus thermomutatus]|uniref:Extracellular membrane protein CFEM domain-containing protein n=1 Tax=Aspergillus thermomutatus TaxID=41047 RepID=A0A397HCD7_ASPTH|nr:uncharacterized protein CDV56_108106 [Aspergillus thermomutatus]RHZ60712.1 hypothetical protein CDV56_108106 [Aspergillus thermomutatus]